MKHVQEGRKECVNFLFYLPQTKESVLLKQTSFRFIGFKEM
jgi:hypothetical protein